jgi:hypothetical protein
MSRPCRTCCDGKKNEAATCRARCGRRRAKGGLGRRAGYGRGRRGRGWARAVAGRRWCRGGRGRTGGSRVKAGGGCGMRVATGEGGGRAQATGEGGGRAQAVGEGGGAGGGRRRPRVGLRLSRFAEGERLVFVGPRRAKALHKPAPPTSANDTLAGRGFEPKVMFTFHCGSVSLYQYLRRLSTPAAYD